MREVAVLIIADDDDPHALLILSLLSQKDVPALTLNLAKLRGVPLSIQRSQLTIGSGADARRLASSTTVWWYRAGTTPVEDLDPDEAALIADENPHLLRGALEACGVRWVDPPHIVTRAEVKLYQLAVADQLGIRTPDTLVTSTPEEAGRFQTGRRVVTKALSPGLGIAPFTSEVGSQDLQALTTNPALLQELVTATDDARVVVVNGESWVWTRPREASSVDWRQADPGGTGFRQADDLAIGSMALQVSSALQLTMSVQDWLVTPDGPVFLEVNPQGAWHFLDGADSLVAPALATHLSEPDQGKPGRWPPALKRFLWDLLPASKAPENDGVLAPHFARPIWINEVATWDGTLDVAQRANAAAQESARAAEDKGSRLVQVSLALITVAIALATFQLTAALGMPWYRMLLVVPALTAIMLIALAAAEALEIDRVGIYGHAQPGDLQQRLGRTRAALAVEAEERGRQLARWTANHKLTDLMQARAWFSRGLAALLLAGLIAGATFALDTVNEPKTGGPPDSSSTTTTSP